MAGIVESDPIPLLTPYKMGKFNLAHRYLFIHPSIEFQSASQIYHITHYVLL